MVILIQENRSFDHYFGTLSGVRGFDDPRGRHAFTQRGADGRKVHPFHLRSDCIADITHSWVPQHQAWNNGRMDRFLAVHEQSDGAPGPETMGYYTRDDLPFYHGLADAFTICDGYHCSVIGPTDPNRLMSLSATIDPAGHAGGPLLHTNVVDRTGGFRWRTMPEQLQAKGVSWKQYTDAGGGVFDNVLTYFDQYRKGTALYDRGVAPTLDDFRSDLAANRLPQVSWVLLNLGETEHPGFSSPGHGELGARQVVEALSAVPETWRKTALFITWDENGGFFDHVAPPVPKPGTAGEYLTVASLPSDAGGIRGPIGLGFRVPMLVVSPFSTGGLVCSRTFDHTSTLRFLESRFGARVPNLSAWRRRVSGDLTGAFDFAARPNTRRPRLPQPGSLAACSSYPAAGVTAGPMPRQERRPRRRRPSGSARR
ncbi:MAG: phospholipase [Actinobacteria bacterium]|nr:phospholipase [Actinomycetota bacterium]